jgi:hypothetical protein
MNTTAQNRGFLLMWATLAIARLNEKMPADPPRRVTRGYVALRQALVRLAKHYDPSVVGLNEDPWLSYHAALAAFHIELESMDLVDEGIKYLEHILIMFGQYAWPNRSSIDLNQELAQALGSILESVRVGLFEFLDEEQAGSCPLGILNDVAWRRVAFVETHVLQTYIGAQAPFDPAMRPPIYFDVDPAIVGIVSDNFQALISANLRRVTRRWAKLLVLDCGIPSIVRQASGFQRVNLTEASMEMKVTAWDLHLGHLAASFSSNSWLLEDFRIDADSPEFHWDRWLETAVRFRDADLHALEMESELESESVFDEVSDGDESDDGWQEYELGLLSPVPPGPDPSQVAVRSISYAVLLEEGMSCAICMSAHNPMVELKVCKHVFGEECLRAQFNSTMTSRYKCAICRADILEM